jgi:hypothetical protein
VIPLAAALDCVLEWIAQAMEEARSAGAFGSDLEIMRLNPSEGLAAMKLLAKGTSLAHSPNNYLRYLQAPVLEFIYRLFAGNWGLDSSRATNSAGGRAVFDLLPSVEWMAVPVALAGPAFATQKRLWYMRPVKRNGILSWEVTWHGLLFGCRAINEEPGYVTIMKISVSLGGIGRTERACQSYHNVLLFRSLSKFLIKYFVLGISCNKGL